MHVMRFETATCDSISASRESATSYACTHHVPKRNGACREPGHGVAIHGALVTHIACTRFAW
jgi:hypothetical protein